MLTRADLLRLRGVQTFDHVVKGSDPAAGAEFSVSVPGGEIWLVQSLLVRLVADATVISRQPVLLLDDGTDIFARLADTAVVLASASADINWLAGLGAAGSASTALVHDVPLPPIPLPAGYRLRSSTANLQAGDNYGAPTLFVTVVRPHGEGREEYSGIERELAGVA